MIQLPAAVTLLELSAQIVAGDAHTAHGSSLIPAATPAATTTTAAGPSNSGDQDAIQVRSFS